MLRISAFDAHRWADESAITRRVTPSRACLPGEDPADKHALALVPIEPLPAVGGVTLRFRLPDAAAAPGEAARLAIHDARGRTLRTWTLDVPQSEPQSVVWDGRDAGGRAVPPGLYFVRLAGAGRVASRRFVYLGNGLAP
jgi:hypothetical protein